MLCMNGLPAGLPAYLLHVQQSLRTESVMSSQRHEENGDRSDVGTKEAEHYGGSKRKETETKGIVSNETKCDITHFL